MISLGKNALELHFPYSVIYNWNKIWDLFLVVTIQAGPVAL